MTSAWSPTRLCVIHLLRCFSRRRRVFMGFVLFVYSVFVLYVAMNRSSTPAHSQLATSMTWSDFRADYRHRFHRDPPAGMKNWLQFASNHNCDKSDFYNAIEEDLSPFRESAPLQYDTVVAEASKRSDLAAIVTIADNDVSFEPLGNRSFLPFVDEIRLRWLLDPAIRHRPSLKLKFVMSFHDHLPNPSMTMPPLFGYSTIIQEKNDSRRSGIRMPYIDSVASPVEKVIQWVTGIPDTMRNIFTLGSLKEPSWEKKLSSLVWRGSSTGSVIGPRSNWRDTPRFRLIRDFGNKGVVSIVPGVKVDVAIVSIIQCVDDEECKKPKQEYRSDYYRTKLWLFQHKYLLDVDGNAFTSRFPLLLASRSLVFKATKYREWHDERIQPWKHYIPVSYDYSDLKDKVRLARDYDKESKMIADRSSQLAQRHLRVVDMQCYMYRLLLEYHSLFLSH